MSLISTKSGKIFIFRRIEDGKEDILRYDIVENKFYKLGKEVAESTAKKFFANLNINDFILSCDSKELKNFLTYIYRNENSFDSRIKNIGTFLCRISDYKNREKLAVLGIFPMIRANHRIEEISTSDVPDNVKNVLEEFSNRWVGKDISMSYKHSDTNCYYNGDIKQHIISKFYADLIISSNYNKGNTLRMLKFLNDIISLRNAGRFSHLRNIDKIVNYLTFNNLDYNGFGGYLPKGFSSLKTIFELYEKYNMSITNLVGYIHYCIFIEDIRVDSFSTLYKDTLNMGEKLNRLVKYPKHLKSIHDINQKYMNMLNKKYDNDVFKELLLKNSKYEQTVQHKGHDISFWLPEDYQSIQTEAIQLNHCVASYIEDYMDMKCILIFIRKNDDLYKPYITLEIVNDEIRQARGSYHRKVDEEELKIISKYAKLVDLKLNINMED